MRGSTAGMSEGMIGPSKNIHTMFLMFVDVMFSSLVIAPLIVTYWHGTWMCMDHVLRAGGDHTFWVEHSEVLSLFIGVFGHFFFTMTQKWWQRAFHPDRHRIAFFVTSRLHTYVYGIVCVNTWRGGFQLLALYMPTSLTLPLIIVSLVSLVLLKGLRNISAAPFAVVTDHSKDYFLFPTMFKKVCARVLLAD